jgi:hypothetical protein
MVAVEIVQLLVLLTQVIMAVQEQKLDLVAIVHVLLVLLSTVVYLLVHFAVLTQALGAELYAITTDLTVQFALLLVQVMKILQAAYLVQTLDAVLTVLL